MTPSERERRLSAAVDALLADSGLPKFGGHRPTVERWQRIAFGAADEAVPVVSEAEFREREEAIQATGKTYRYWQAHYKERAERAEAATRDMAQALDDIASFRPKSYPAFARNVLARHPSFSGEEGTEG